MSFPTQAVMDWLSNDGLRGKLIEECKKYHIFAEDDLQFSAYYHIRKFLDEPGVDNEGYFRTYNKQYLKSSNDYGKFPDLTIYKNEKREILIELKQTIERNVRTEEIIDDVRKLATIGGDMRLISLYTCGLDEEDSNERYSEIMESIDNIENTQNLRLVRVAVGPHFDWDAVRLQTFRENVRRLSLQWGGLK